MSTQTAENLRQTGRTTRLIDHARQLSNEGRAVYILAASEREADRIRNLVGDGPHGIKVESVHDMDHEFDWRTLRLRGAHPNCVVLLDHLAIENHIAHLKPLLKMLHAYDA